MLRAGLPTAALEATHRQKPRGAKCHLEGAAPSQGGSRRCGRLPLAASSTGVPKEGNDLGSIHRTPNTKIFLGKLRAFDANGVLVLREQADAAAGAQAAAHRQASPRALAQSQEAPQEKPLPNRLRVWAKLPVAWG